MVKTNNLFIPVVGEFANVGDVMHRNELLKWIRPCGVLHVFVGKAPADFVHGLELPNNAVVYSSIFRWLIALLSSPFRKTHFVFNSGEITVSNRRLLIEILLFPFLLVVKLKGGKILRVGIAAASNVKVRFKFLWNGLFRLSDLIMWRTHISRDAFKKGKVIPDLAFAGSGTQSILEPPGLRKILVISQRWDRPYPNSTWLQAVKDFGKAHNLNIQVVSQVRKDNPMCEKLAIDLDGQAILWNDNISHLVQERMLRAIYRNSLFAISDRLHVLIAAITEGVIPSTILTKPSDKVKHHFDVIQLEAVSIYTLEYNEIQGFLEDKISMYGEIMSKLSNAQITLSKAKSEVQKILS